MNKGFTLIELLVAIAIIGILASLTLANFTGSQARARDTQRKNDLKIVRDALEQYKIDRGYYPYQNAAGNDMTAVAQTADLNNAAFVTQFNTIAGSSNTVSGLGNTTVGAYLRNSPTDPRNTGNLQYRYAPTSSGAGYTLEACLENGQDQQRYKNASGTYTVLLPCTSTNPNYRVFNP